MEQELPMATRGEEQNRVPDEALQNIEVPQNAGGGGVSPEKFAKVMMTPLTVIASTSLQGLTGLIKSDSPTALCFSLFMCALVSSSGTIVCLRLVMEANDFDRSEGERLKTMVSTYLYFSIGIMVSTLFGNMLTIVYDVPSNASAGASLAASAVLVWSYTGFSLPKRLLQFRIIKCIWRPGFLLFVIAILGNSLLLKLKNSQASAGV